MSETTFDKNNRPLSPHLQVYKPQLTSGMSIFHRVTGAALAVGTLLVVYLLVAAGTGQNAYNTAMALITCPLGIAAMFGWTWALFYHMCNGIRHLFWDMGYLFKLENAYKAGYLVLAASFVLTALTWYSAYNMNGEAERIMIEASATDSQDITEGAAE